MPPPGAPARPLQAPAPARGAQVLRDKAHVTRLLILRELHATPNASLREVGDRIGITVQAVSNHAKALARAGLVAAAADGRYHPTPTGVQHLQDGLAGLKRAVDEAVLPLARIDAASAIAATPIRAGERAGLFMEEGELVARVGVPSASTGKAVAPALAGDEVILRDLTGVVELRPGRIWIVPLPGPQEGGVMGVSPRRLKARLKAQGVESARVGALGAGAKVMAARCDWVPDFTFAPASAAFNAAELGQRVLLLVTRDRLQECLGALDALNAATLTRIPIEIVEERGGDAK